MTEQQPYQIVQSHEDFQVRSYPGHLLAEVITEGSFEGAGNRAFRYLFAYIAGENRSSQKVAMTAPVVQDSASETIEMTAPVVQQGIEMRPGSAEIPRFRVAFVLPEGFTLENAPRPTSPLVHLRAVPETLAAVISFSGRWTAASYQHHLDTLRSAVAAAGLTPIGTPRFARFDPPIKPSFMRRNEIILDLENPG
ncbi:SOUL family heme-binding protein [Arthrobacter sp. H14-L1]|uniref:SOUL family heme-binding protein n=1 Tax=Arthrobacter sp. H14-L1 TaxID=2996697 RepID=UPI00226DED23|nr:heme-binding protein [Arthrobacter sp. H14-L1]MCY0906154.1 heme-binding protein [Arthrobacter sp. H14-L1]